jgi:hypothetical protein
MGATSRKRGFILTGIKMDRKMRKKTTKMEREKDLLLIGMKTDRSRLKETT